MSITITAHPSPAVFLQRAQPFFERDEVLHNLPLGVALRMRDAAPDPAQDWLTLEEHGQVVGAVMRTPPHNPVLTRLPPGGVEAVVEYYRSRQVELSGLFGPAAETAAFARRWSELTGRTVEVRWEMRLSACRSLRRAAAPPANSLLRPPVPGDRDALAECIRGFHEDVQMPAPEDLLAAADRVIERGQAIVCEAEGTIVSCADIVRESPSGATIGLVYTPPPHRGRGYATASVAELTRRQFLAGKEFCCLFSNMSEPVPNHIYRSLGYDEVERFLWWGFAAAE